MKIIFFIVLMIIGVNASADPMFWYAGRDKIIGVGGLTEDKSCGGYSNGFVVHKGVIKSVNISKIWVTLLVDLDKNYVESSGLTTRNFSLSHDYLLQMDVDKYDDFFNFLRSKETMIFTGHVCGATQSSEVELDSIFKFSSIVKK